MRVRPDLSERVEARFARRDPALATWDAPHPHRPPLDEEYSRVSEPGRWRIVAARADAWVDALVDVGLASREDVAASDTVWAARSEVVATSVTRVLPTAAGALTVTLARTAMGPVPDAGVVLGVGEPAHPLDPVPDCGCDACDGGSADVLEPVDAVWTAIVTGALRRLTRERTTIVAGVGDPTAWSARADGPAAPGRLEIAAALADPVGWHVLAGAAWW